ncbi:MULTISPECIES: mechanosensitive ion channel family protein [Bacillus]|uniref:mechanosensitive ion channel family protein n=1 Tax=Bacillus TaxID=1386 RepID=UPI0003051FEB|nr:MULTISPECIES: mechanosensitive ion channel family protein [Bacillus]
MDFSSKVVDRFISKFTDEELWLNIMDVSIKIMLILIIAGIVVKIGKKIITNIFVLRDKSPLRTSERREITMARLLKSVLSYCIYFIALMTILDSLGIPVKGLIAGAGVLGLAVGFGAQSLVKDIITGFFIIFEDQFAVGDYVRIGTVEGTVEEIGLRTSKIKGISGELNVIPNGNILEVTNFSIHNSVAIVDIGIAYEGDVDQAERVINHLLESMPDRYEDLVKAPELLGVQSFGPSEVVLRITAETLPMRHFYIARQLRRELKETLDANGIEIPFPRMVMYNRQEKDHNGQTAKQL